MTMNLNAAKARELTHEALIKERQKYEPIAERYIADYIENKIREACERGNKGREIIMPDDMTLRKYIRECLEENGFSVNWCNAWFVSWNDKEE